MLRIEDMFGDYRLLPMRSLILDIIYFIRWLSDLFCMPNSRNYNQSKIFGKLHNVYLVVFYQEGKCIGWPANKVYLILFVM